MFAPGLVSLGEPPDYPILLSRHALPDSVRRLLNPDMLLRRPADQRLRHAYSVHGRTIGNNSSFLHRHPNYLCYRSCNKICMRVVR